MNQNTKLILIAMFSMIMLIGILFRVAGIWLNYVYIGIIIISLLIFLYSGWKSTPRWLLLIVSLSHIFLVWFLIGSPGWSDLGPRECIDDSECEMAISPVDKNIYCIKAIDLDKYLKGEKLLRERNVKKQEGGTCSCIESFCRWGK